MSYKLYGDLGSGAFSAEAALAEAGAPYEFELISLEKGEQKEPRFLSLNPSGKIPALRLPEGEIVTEFVGHPAHPGRSFPAERVVAAPGRARARHRLSLARLHGERDLSLCRDRGLSRALCAGRRGRRGAA